MEYSYQKYKTDLSDKLEEISLEPIYYLEIVKNFKNGIYKTYRTIKRVELYRVYGCRYKEGRGALLIGAFATTEFAESRIDVKIRLALDPAWHNAKLVEAKIVVPIGITLNVGVIAPVCLKTGTLLEGEADQILLQFNWGKEWIVGYREVTSKPLLEYPDYCEMAPKCYRDRKDKEQ